MEFERDWRRHCCKGDDMVSKKVKYLRLCGTEVARKLFRTELDANLMGAVLDALDKMLTLQGQGQEDEVQDEASSSDSLSPLTLPEVVSWLNLFPSCGRFSLNLSFLEPQHLKSAHAIIDWVAAATAAEGVDVAVEVDIDKLKATYEYK